MKARLTSFALALALLGAFLMLPGSAVAQTNPFDNISVTGTCPGGPFTGTLDITGFARQNGQLVALGNLTGTCPGGSASNLPVALPVDLQQTTGTCEILNLVLGPLHLDVLGLVVDLNQVELEIAAESAPGNLLGNLLCAITHLLDAPGSPLGGLAALLNGILGILQGL
jgi:hypothetical protein